MCSRSDKMKGKSLRFRINLWYTVLMCFVCVALLGCVVAAARTAEKSLAQQNLIRSVERNIDEIEVENGILDIESDFAYLNDDVHALVFSKDGRLLGGEYPEGVEINLPLESEGIRMVGNYYVYDSLINFSKFEYKINGITGEIISSECDGIDSYTPFEGDINTVGEDCILSYREAYEIALKHSDRTKKNTDLMVARSYEYNDEPLYEIEFFSKKPGYSDIWVRGVMSAKEVDSIWGTIVAIATVLVPLVVLIACFVGSMIAKKAMLPIERLSSAVSEIQSGEDLTKQLDIGDSDPMIKSLTGNFNKMNERLHRSFEAERQFTSDVSHELRTPTSVILAECEYQLGDDVDKDEMREGFETISKQASSMKQIILQLLYFARIDRGNEKPTFEKDDLGELVKAVTGDMQSACKKDIEFITDIDKNTEMNFDISMMTRLVTNLISNAVTYQNDGGQVKVTLKNKKDSILLTVSDKGFGISEEHIDKIWGRFYRVDKARSREDGCSGLGLPMVKQLVELHGGKVWAESELGKGSTFFVEFRK